MLIEKITEVNYEQKREEGRKRVEEKLKSIERQFNNYAAVSDISVEKPAINWYLFFDPTIWAYKVLKDKQNTPLVLRGFQDKVLNDKHPVILVAGSNQIGKTYGIGIKAIHHALHVNNASVLIISRSEQQSIYILDEIKLLMKASNIPFESIIGKVENRTELHITNSNKIGVSVIRCLPPTLSVYAYPATLIICDEIGFWEIDGMTQSEFFYKVIMSRINETRNWKKNCICGESCGHFTMGQVIAISTTNGQQGIMWNLWCDSNVNQYRYNFLANPSNSYEEFKKWKENPPEGYTMDMFASMFDASFTSASGGFITQAEWDDAVKDYLVMPPPNLPIYLGGDFSGEDTKGRDLDLNALFGVISFKFSSSLKEMIKVVYEKTFAARTRREIIYENIKHLNVAKFAYDKVGIGDSVKNDLKDRNILQEYQIESLTYSLPNKSEVYYNLKHLFEQRKIIVPNLPELKKQLLGLRFEKTEGGYIKVHHATEGLKDDLADALANACYAARIKNKEPYIGIATKASISQILDQNKLNTLICPECEKIDYKGMAGYYKGHSQSHINFERINCPRHKVEITI